MNYRNTILLPTFLLFSLIAIAQSWSAGEIRENARKLGELDRLQEADRIEQDSTGYMGNASLSFTELSRQKHGISIPGRNLEDSIHIWVNSCLPKSYLQLEAQRYQIAAAEQASKDSAWAAYQTRLAYNDSLQKVISKADTDSLPDDFLIPMLLNAPVLAHVQQQDVKVFMLAKDLYGVKEARRLQLVAQKYINGDWDLRKLARQTPSTREWPSTRNQRGTSSSGSRQACGEWVKGGCGIQNGNPGNNRSGNHRR